MVKKALLASLGALVLFGLVLQLVPYGRNHTNPPVQVEPQWDSPRTQELFFRACADCHSNETVWPWYSNVAPMSWLIQRDVDEGRARFNISEQGIGGENHGEEAAETVSRGTMPMAVYVPLHPAALLSAQEKREFIQGLAATFGGETEAETGEGGEGDD